MAVFSDTAAAAVLALARPWDWKNNCRVASWKTVPLSLAGRKIFLQACNQLIAQVHEVWTTDWRSLRLHGDLHIDNILWRYGQTFVDLDDARHGPAVQDLWMLLNGDRRDRLYQLSLLLDAYAEFMDFDPHPGELALIEPLRAMQIIHYLSWVSRRWGDLAFPRSFPWVVEAEFWSQQTAL